MVSLLSVKVVHTILNILTVKAGQKTPSSKTSEAFPGPCERFHRKVLHGTFGWNLSHILNKYRNFEC